ncbi:MAG: hypothetical protein ACKVQV_05640 [Bacteroidia bacterium]
MLNNVVRIFLLSMLLLLLLPFSPMLAQLNSSKVVPQISDRFEYPFYKESFDSVAKGWPFLSNSENLLLIQEGEYIIQRKSKLSPFAVMGEFEQELSTYRLITSLKLVKSASTDGSIGLIFMAQPAGKGGFVFEINQFQQYRLRQITVTGYAYLTGVAKDGGWVKSSVLKENNLANLLELRTKDKKYDLYLNNTLILTFSELAYKSGGIGFIIGPGTLGKVDFMYLFSNEKVEGLSREDVAESTSEGDVIALAESIIELKTKLNKLEAENEELTSRIASFKGSEKEQEKEKAAYEAKFSSMDKQVAMKQKSIDSLLQINQELTKYKDIVKANSGEDLVITLSKKLKAEKLRADDFALENEALRDSIINLKKITKSAPAEKSPKKPIEKSSDPEDKVFVLPKEN